MHVVTLISTPDWDPVLIDDSYTEDFEDISHIGKAIAMSSLKPLMFCLGKLIRSLLHSSLQSLITFLLCVPTTSARILPNSVCHEYLYCILPYTAALDESF